MSPVVSQSLCSDGKRKSCTRAVAMITAPHPTQMSTGSDKVRDFLTRPTAATRSNVVPTRRMASTVGSVTSALPAFSASSTVVGKTGAHHQRPADRERGDRRGDRRDGPVAAPSRRPVGEPRGRRTTRPPRSSRATTRVQNAKLAVLGPTCATTGSTPSTSAITPKSAESEEVGLAPRASVPQREDDAHRQRGHARERAGEDGDARQRIREQQRGDAPDQRRHRRRDHTDKDDRRARLPLPESARIEHPVPLATHPGPTPCPGPPPTPRR